MKTKHYLNGKSILITGGTGSFGKKCIDYLLKNRKIRRLVIYSRDELKQEEMRTIYKYTDSRLRYFIGDIRDKDRLWRALNDIDVVIHAAALKQVPACEYNPTEAIKTNIIGAENIIATAIDRGVKRVIALSTDKAVNPINLYGATKLVSEKLFVQGNNYSGPNGTRFSCVRYGNVMGSRGSVIPLFLHQKSTGIITLTDDQMTRFWITLDQGVGFVIENLESMVGGEIFIPKIPSMRILDLAKAIAPECKIKIIGIRPGEKLHEVLVSQDEARNTYELANKFIIRPVNIFREPKNILWKKARLMKKALFSSDSNDHWLTIKQLQKLL